MKLSRTVQITWSTDLSSRVLWSSDGDCLTDGLKGLEQKELK